jgi:hypothetical protein
MTTKMFIAGFRGSVEGINLSVVFENTDLEQATRHASTTLSEKLLDHTFVGCREALPGEVQQWESLNNAIGKLNETLDR